MRNLLAAASLLFSLPALAQPLTLAQALAAADDGHPDVMAAVADRNMARAEEGLAGARSDWSVTFEAGLRRVKPSLAEGFTDDHSNRLTARKTLHDFGRTDSGEWAARRETEAREAALMEARDRQRLEIMARFFEVLTTDLQYTADSEHMAVAFVEWDRARERAALGQVSPVEVAELEARYQDRLQIRNQTRNRQRLARALLAEAMNRPGNLAGELAEPRLADNGRAVPDYESLLPQALEHNSRYRVQAALLAASRLRMEALRAEGLPSIDMELENGRYTRETSGRDDLRGGVVLSWPLWQGRRVDARVQKEQARFHRLQAETEKLRREISHALLELVLEIEQLQKSGRQAAARNSAWRDLGLERARGEYELEVRTTLGGAMAMTVEARLRERRNEYRLALALARLDALLGRPRDGREKE